MCLFQVARLILLGMIVQRDVAIVRTVTLVAAVTAFAMLGVTQGTNIVSAKMVSSLSPSLEMRLFYVCKN